jgi:hypothetical protein
MEKGADFFVFIFSEDNLFLLLLSLVVLDLLSCNGNEFFFCSSFFIFIFGNDFILFEKWRFFLLFVFIFSLLFFIFLF